MEGDHLQHGQISFLASGSFSCDFPMVVVEHGVFGPLSEVTTVHSYGPKRIQTLHLLFLDLYGPTAFPFGLLSVVNANFYGPKKRIQSFSFISGSFPAN